jgi:hypothetical protein
MSWLQGVTARTAIAGELLAFFWSHKWWWLTPMIGVLLLLFVFILLAQSSGLAPFLYTLF